MHSFRAILCPFLYQNEIKNLCVNASFQAQNPVVYIHKAIRPYRTKGQRNAESNLRATKT